MTARFLADNGLEYLIRSHEVKDDGYVVEHVSARLTLRNLACARRRAPAD